MPSTPAVSWSDLNERQQTYLLTIYQRDQAEEEAQRSAWSRGVRARPADEWRWMYYGETAYGPSPLKRALDSEGLVNQGTGATLEALRSRGLVLVRSSRSVSRGDLSTVHVRMTLAGRKLARQASGEVREKKLPAGTLREWHWHALVQMYRSGGLQTDGWGSDYYALDDDAHDWHNRTTWETVRRLEDYRWGALCHDVGGFTMRYGLTPFGRAYYERERVRYRELYPDVDAPEPAHAKR